MSRGSTGLGASGGTTVTGTEMLGSTGSMDASGKRTLTKKFFVTTEGDLTKAPTVTGYIATAISHTKLGAGWEQTVQYEALDLTLGGSTGFSQANEKGSFEIISSYELRPIGRHPRIGKLKKKYNGREEFGEIVFDEFLSAGTGVGSKSRRNPMYQVKSYREYTFTVRHTYYKETVGKDIFDKAGTTTNKLPGNVPVPKGATDSDGKEIKRYFQIQMPNLRREGNAWRVEQDYVLVDAAGFADDIFEK